jgi:hypothetical protein
MGKKQHKQSAAEDLAEEQAIGRAWNELIFSAIKAAIARGDLYLGVRIPIPPQLRKRQAELDRKRKRQTDCN